jgi:hypothetical protein
MWLLSSTPLEGEGQGEERANRHTHVTPQLAHTHIHAHTERGGRGDIRAHTHTQRREFTEMQAEITERGNLHKGASRGKGILLGSTTAHLRIHLADGRLPGGERCSPGPVGLSHGRCQPCACGPAVQQMPPSSKCRQGSNAGSCLQGCGAGRIQQWQKAEAATLSPSQGLPQGPSLLAVVD